MIKCQCKKEQERLYNMKCYQMTDVGSLRQTNQDAVYSSLEPVGNLDNLFIVADGMGGHLAGEYASFQAIQETVKVIRKSEEKRPVRLLEMGITCANEAIFQTAQQDKDKRGMGTTMVAATVVEEQLVVANVGDSRLYVWKGQQLEQITKDHSVVEELIRQGELTREESRFHAKKSVITRAVGAEAQVKIDIFDIPLHQVSYILMCTDGLTNMVSEEHISRILNAAETLEAKGKELVAVANQNGGKDNITIVLIEINDNEVKAC